MGVRTSITRVERVADIIATVDAGAGDASRIGAEFNWDCDVPERLKVMRTDALLKGVERPFVFQP